MEKKSITSNDVSDIRFLIYFGKYFSASAKAIVRSCSVTKVFFKILQNSQENIWVASSFLIKRLRYRYFPVIYTEFLITPIL